MVLEHVPAPRKARIKATGPDITSLKQKHSLTIIGRVTNPSVQKVWALIPFFTDHWKADIPPVGADLGLGTFQFQFELESDLITVLEKQPYHYARWMIILQRWEPTVSPDFPSMIPFWIKIQGIPIHLWSEGTVRSIGEDIGTFESAEISSTSVRMRVHVNGRLPLIKTSVIEYDNGDEVTATLQYERLEKHCSQCLKLDHEYRDCLEAKALKKAMATAHGDSQKSIAELPPAPRRKEQERTAERTTRLPFRQTENSRALHDKSRSRYSTHTPLYGNALSRSGYQDRDQRDRLSQRKEWQPRSKLQTESYSKAREGSNYRYERGSHRGHDSVRGDSHSHLDLTAQQHHSGLAREEERRSPTTYRSPPYSKRFLQPQGTKLSHLRGGFPSGCVMITYLRMQLRLQWEKYGR